MPEVSIQIVESRAPAPLKRFQEAGKSVMHSSSLTVVLPVSVLEDAQWPAMGPIDGRTQPPKDEDEEAQLEELLGTHNAEMSAELAREKEARINQMQKSLMRRMINLDLTRGWQAWLRFYMTGRGI